MHKNLQSGKPAGGGVKAIYAGVVGRGERLVFQPIVGEIALFPACHVKQRFMRARRGGEHGLGLAFPNRFEFALQHLIGVQQRQKPLHEPAVRATPHGLIPADKEKRSGTIHHHDSPRAFRPAIWEAHRNPSTFPLARKRSSARSSRSCQRAASAYARRRGRFGEPAWPLPIVRAAQWRLTARDCHQNWAARERSGRSMLPKRRGAERASPVKQVLDFAEAVH